MIRVQVDQAGLQRLREMPGMWQRSLQVATMAVASRSANRLKDTAPKATSLMANSIRPYPTATGAEVLVGTNYAGWAHDGRKAGKVDIGAITDWAKTIGLPKRAGFAIAHSIARKGTKAQPWVNDFVKSIEMRKLVRQAVTDALG